MTPAVSDQRARPLTPVWIWVLALLCFLVSVVFAFGALVYLGVDCTDDGGSGCASASYGQFGIALMGVVLSVAAMIAAAVRCVLASGCALPRSRLLRGFWWRSLLASPRRRG